MKKEYLKLIDAYIEKNREYHIVSKQYRKTLEAWFDDCTIDYKPIEAKYKKVCEELFKIQFKLDEYYKQEECTNCKNIQF